jgi:hypothetical protein
MSPLLIQPIRSIKPISFAQSMQRAKEGDRPQNWMSQMPSSNPATVIDLIAPQANPLDIKSPTISAMFSTLALVQMLPPRSVSPARLQDYTAMASSNDDDADLSVGQRFDMHA